MKRRRRRRKQGGEGRWKARLGWGALGAAAVLFLGGKRPAGRSDRSSGTGLGKRYQPNVGRSPASVAGAWVVGAEGSLYLQHSAVNGSGAGTRTLLLHGLGGSGDQWQPVMRLLGGEFQVASFDFRGHGRSDPADSLSMDDLVEDIGAALMALGWVDCRLIGHDLGAIAALAFAARHPNRVSGILLVEPPPGPGALPAVALEDLLVSVAEDPRGEMRLQFQPLLAGASPESRDQILLDLERAGALALTAGFEVLVSHDGAQLASGLGGKVQALLSPLASSSEEWLERGGIPVRKLSGQGHWPMLEPSAELLSALAEWILDR